MKTTRKRLSYLTIWSAVALLAGHVATAAGPVDASRAFKKARDAVEFADHVEDGLKISRTVSRAKNIADVGNATERVEQEVQGDKTARLGNEAVESAAETVGASAGAEIAKAAATEVSQAIFAEAIEDEIEDQVMKQGRKALHKAIRP